MKTPSLYNLFSNAIPTCYQFIKTSLSFVANSKTMTSILLLQGSVIEVLAKPIHAVALSNYNQSPLKNSDAIFTNTCLQVEELNFFYNIKTNVVLLTDVKYYIFLETNHSNWMHRDWMIDFSSKLSSPGDVFLFEGFSRNDEIHCSTIGSYVDMPQKSSGLTTKQSRHPLPAPPRDKFRVYNISSNFRCYGWEDPKQVNNPKKHEKWYKDHEEKVGFFAHPGQPGMDIPNNVYKALTVNMRFVNYPEIKFSLGKAIGDFDKLLNMPSFQKYIVPKTRQTLIDFDKLKYGKLATDTQTINPKIEYGKLVQDFTVICQSIIRQINLHVNTETKKVLASRIYQGNKGAIKTLDSYSSSPGLIFSVFGAGHFFGNKKHDPVTHVFTNKSAEAELINSLSDKPYAILIPKR